MEHRASPSGPNRLPVRWAACLATWCGFVAVAALLRWLGEWSNPTLRDSEQTQLRVLLLLHSGSALILTLAAFAIHRSWTARDCWSKSLALCTPLLLLASADRISDYLIPALQESPNVVAWDRDLGWRLRPSSEGEWGGPVTINARGLRGPERADAKDEDEFRILFVGDSITFGYGVEFGEGYVARIEEILDARLAAHHVQTLALAVVGYSTWQHRTLLELEGLAYQPDLVVLGFCLNDVTEKFALARYGGHMHDPETAALGRRLRNCGLYRLAIMSYARLNRSRGMETDELMADLKVMDLFMRPDTTRVDRAWRETEEDLQGLAQLCQLARVPLGVVCFPYEFQLPSNSPPPHPQRRLAAWCGDNAVPFLDLLPAMRNSANAPPSEGPRLMLDACHPSSSGHLLAAREIAEFLDQAGLLPQTALADSSDAPPDDKATLLWTDAAPPR